MNKHSASYCLLFLFTCSNSVSALQNSKKIPDVTVRTNSKRTSISGSTTHTITRQQFVLTGASSISDALHSAPGLQLHDASGNGSYTSISMRGFGANAASNSLILVNGIPLSNPDLAPPDLNTLPLEDINRIEIIAGSESVIYGDQAVGGLINIMTDDSDEKSIRLQCSAGSYLTKECHARIADSYRALAYQLNVTSKSSSNYRQHNHYLNSTLLGGAVYKQDKHSFSLDYKLTNENMQYPGALTSAQVRQNRRQANNATDYFKDNNQYLHLRYHLPLQQSWKFSADAFVRSMSGLGVLMAQFTQSRGSFFIKPQLTSDNDQRKINLGIDGRIDKYHLQSPFGLTNNDQSQYGLFGLLNKKLDDKLALIVGVRGAQQNTQLHTNISASTVNRATATTIGISYNLKNDVFLYLRRAGSYRFPKADENTAGHQPLRTQRGNSYETGISYDTDNRAIDFSLFMLRLRDEIAFDPQQTPQNPFGTNTNLAPTIRTGGSISLKQKLSSFTLDSQINYTDARFRSGINSGKQIPLVSDWTAHGGVLYRLSSHLHAYAEAVFTGKQFPANDNANITGGQGGYTVFNFNIRYQYQLFSAALHFNNLFNKEYYLYTVYQPSLTTEYFYPAPERNYMLTVNYLLD
ncbi:MAG TPA: TonB-dependent receptor [Gammaproteobacteria bacterium]|nr:TonB-dependent receptor [Gammaproteobacteria bacterium]